MPRVLVLRNAEHDSDAYRPTITQVLTNSAMRDDYLNDVSAATSDMRKQQTSEALYHAFSTNASHAGADINSMARVYTAFDVRNSDGMAIMPHSYAALTVTDCIYAAKISDTAAASDARDQLLLATGIPDLLATLMHPFFSDVIAVLQPLIASLQSLCTGVTKLKTALLAPPVSTNTRQSSGKLNDSRSDNSSSSSSSGISSAAGSGSSTSNSKTSSSNERLRHIRSVRDRGKAVTSSHSKHSTNGILRQIETEQCKAMREHIAKSELELQVLTLSAHHSTYYLML
jgi:hypothetical protein